MKLRGRCTGPLSPRLAGATFDDEGQVVIEGRHIVRGCGDSPLSTTTFARCPWALARSASSAIELRRRVSNTPLTISEYVGGPPGGHASEAIELIEAELDPVRKLLAKEAAEAAKVGGSDG